MPPKRSPMKKTTPKARARVASEETRVAIMEAAERLFGEEGIDAAAMRAISSAAGQKNASSVQYHFKDRDGLLQAIFIYREGQLDTMRAELLEEARALGHLDDVRWLLRAIFYPEFRHYMDHDGLPYIRLHAQYLANLRPRGVPHPVDYECPSTAAYRRAIGLLRQCLSDLSHEEYFLRLESVGAMFLGALMQHAARDQFHKERQPALFATLLEMMTAAMTVSVTA